MLQLCVALFRLLGKHAAIGLAALLLCISPARPALGTEPDKAAAMAHYEAGTRLYDIHEYDAALKEYKAGYLTRPDASFLYNIGQCYKRLGMPVQAREFFREYLKKAARDDRNRAQAEARLHELETEADGTTSRPPASAALPVPVSEGEMSGAEQQPRDSSAKRSALPPANGILASPPARTRSKAAWFSPLSHILTRTSARVSSGGNPATLFRCPFLPNTAMRFTTRRV